MVGGAPEENPVLAPEGGPKPNELGEGVDGGGFPNGDVDCSGGTPKVEVFPNTELFGG